MGIWFNLSARSESEREREKMAGTSVSAEREWIASACKWSEVIVRGSAVDVE